jgi:hypothetical protein
VKKFALLFALLVVVAIGVWWLQRPAAPSAPAIAVVEADSKSMTPAPRAMPAEAMAPTAPTVAPAAASPAPAPAARMVMERPPGKLSVNDVVLPGNRISDPEIGLAATYPENWTVRDVALRWGVNEGENTIFFGLPDGMQGTSSMYYRKYTDGPAFSMANPEATLRDMAQQKEVSRIADGRKDYRNDPDSFVFRTIDGNPSLSYFATYTQPNTGEVHAEYFLRILGPGGYVMFFNYGPAKDIQALIPTVFQMAGTVKPP